MLRFLNLTKLGRFVNPYQNLNSSISSNYKINFVKFCSTSGETEKSEEGDKKEKIRPIVPVETSIRYLKSTAYKETYGDHLVWEQYRRNHKGLFPPRKTRKTCIRKGVISTGNPCPICRDEYLVLDYRNIDLLKQFISPQSGEVYSYSKTGLCQKRHLELLIAVEKAMDYGLITFDVPFRKFDYSEYYDNYEKLLNKN